MKILNIQLFRWICLKFIGAKKKLFNLVFVFKKNIYYYFFQSVIYVLNGVYRCIFLYTIPYIVSDCDFVFVTQFQFLTLVSSLCIYVCIGSPFLNNWHNNNNNSHLIEIVKYTKVQEFIVHRNNYDGGEWWRTSTYICSNVYNIYL